MIAMMRIARLVNNIQEGTTDIYDLQTMLEMLDEFMDLSEGNIDEYITNHYEELITWEP